MQCWGDNVFKQTTVPTELATVSVASVSAGEYHTCAVTSAGAVQCWGNNGNGRIDVPTALATGGVASVSAGWTHTCAVTSEGAVQCWGNNDSGQTSVPAALATGGVASVSAGGGHTCAVTSAGAVQCWGYGANGQTTVPFATGQTLLFSAGTPGSPLNAMALSASTTLTATASGAGAEPVVFDTWTPDTCTVSGNTVTTTAQATAGSLCGVRAARAGGSDGAGGTLAAAPTQARLLLLKAQPSLALTSSGSPSRFGAAVTFTAILGNASNPSGEVRFVEGSTTLCTVSLSGGQAQCSPPHLAVGNHSITAVYAGDVKNAGASGGLNQTVNAVAASAPAITSVVAGDAQVAVAWTEPTNNGGAAITGYTVTAYADANRTQAAGTCATPAVSPPAQVATGCMVSGLTNRTAYVFTVMAHNAIGASAASAFSTAATPLASLALTLPAMVTAKVGTALNLPLAASGGSGQYGFVVVSGNLPDGLSLQGAAITGTPTTATAAGTPAMVTVRLTDTGNSNPATNTTEAAMAFTVDKADQTSVVVTSSANPSKPGDDVRFTVAVSAATTPSARLQSKAAALPTGTVTVAGNGATLGTATLVNGSASVVVASLQPGDHSIVVSYSGDDNNAAAQSAVLTQTVSATAVVPTTATPVPSLSAMGVVLLNAMAALMLGLGLRWRRRAAQQPQ